MKTYQENNYIYLEGYEEAPLCDVGEDYTDFLEEFEKFEYKDAAQAYCDLQGFNLVDLDLKDFINNIYFGEYENPYEAGSAFMDYLEPKSTTLKNTLLGSCDTIICIAECFMESNHNYYYII